VRLLPHLSVCFLLFEKISLPPRKTPEGRASGSNLSFLFFTISFPTLHSLFSFFFSSPLIAEKKKERIGTKKQKKRFFMTAHMKDDADSQSKKFD
jgi:hypothetical protein